MMAPSQPHDAERAQRLALTTHTGTGVVLALVSYAAWMSGGIFSPHLDWTMAIPLVPFYLVGRRAGLLWLLAVLSSLLGIAYATWQGWVPAFSALGPAQIQSSFLIHTLAMLLTMCMVYLTDSQYRKLYSERRQRHAELEETRQALLRTSALREQFIATVSHELRTPMNAILGFNEVLLDSVKDQPQALSILNHTRQSADHLMTVINDVLDHSQLQAGTIQVQSETVDLHDTVDKAFSLFKLRATQKGLAYRCEISPDVPRWVASDRHRIMQMLVNLLDNATKFTHQGHVNLRVEQRPVGVLFSVEDSGVGIAEDQKPCIFLHPTSPGEHSRFLRCGGAGLGLSITHRLVQRMWGRMGFDSTAGQGSTFRFSLPLRECSAPLQASPRAAESSKALQFLVVDDVPINRLLVKKVLEKNWPRCRVVEAEDGVQCLAALKQDAFDLVFMDMVMPNMDGIEATQALRNLLPAPACHTPVLGLTANINPLHLERFKASGLSDVMLKPFEPAQLCAQVRTWVTWKKSSPGS